MNLFCGTKIRPLAFRCLALACELLRVRDCRGSEAVVLRRLSLSKPEQNNGGSTECVRNPEKPDRRRRELPDGKYFFMEP